VCVGAGTKIHIVAQQRLDDQGVAGIGWTKEEGVDKYNEIYDLVEEDRVCRGVTFNHELLKVFLERHRNKKYTPGRVNTRKRKTIPRDDMGPIDTSGRSVFDNDGTVHV
jgi:hypothetical protein